MKILGLDSSGMVAGVAIVEDGLLLAEYTTNYKKTHSQTLLPMVEEIVSMLGIDLKELDAIAVAEGPGSFTGIRIGVSTAKALAVVNNIPVVGVTSLEGLAYNIKKDTGIICSLIDANNHQVYCGIFDNNYNLVNF